VQFVGLGLYIEGFGNGYNEHTNNDEIITKSS
jgi:hypothetical protein